MGPSLPSVTSAIDLKGKCGSSAGSNWTLKRRQHRKPRIQNWRRRATVVESMTGVERRIAVLQRLVPNGESMDLAALFKEAADYILCLEMQARVMQVLVKVLSDPA
ncbi:hypothetical protein ACLOJK_026576 [Asimina triloba]